MRAYHARPKCRQSSRRGIHERGDILVTLDVARAIGSLENGHHIEDSGCRIRKSARVSRSLRSGIRYLVRIKGARALKRFPVEEERAGKGAGPAYLRRDSCGATVRYDARNRDDVDPGSDSDFRGKSAEISPDVRNAWASCRSKGGIDKGFPVHRTLRQLPFILRFNLIGFAFREGRIGIFGILERIHWLLVDASSGYRTLEVLHDKRSHGSLIPYRTSGICHSERIVGHGIRARCNHG